MNNYLELKFMSIGENEAFARNAVASFVLGLNPTLEEISDIKTAISEAVTNSVVHGYNESKEGEILIKVSIVERLVVIEVRDYGIGIDDVEKAKQPFYTTKKEDERSGMGFTIMECLMDKLQINSSGDGTVLSMQKEICK